jgi:glycine cleavage system aminomethyltransferase T
MTTLEEKISSAGDAVSMLRNAPSGAYPFPIKAEYTNWRDEQEAWRHSAALMDSSFHMTDFYFRGPDAIRLISDTGINTPRNLVPGVAKQFVALNHDGFVISDAILTVLGPQEVVLIGRSPAPNWVAYQAEVGGYDVEIERDMQSSVNSSPRKLFRFQIQGPNALQIVEKAHGGPIEPIPFFRVGEFQIAGVRVRALNHAMSREIGFEITGPFASADIVKEALIRAGSELGMRLVGSRAYPTMAIESGWVPSPIPAIYSGDALRPYREWLSGDGYEANASLGGSFTSERIDDFYLNVWDLGLERVLKLDHEFIGREAAERMAEHPHRQKVWLRWNDDDVRRMIGTSLFGGEHRTKYLETPVSNYSALSYDRVHIGDELIGLSTTSGYSVNVRGWSSLAMIDADRVVDGAEVTVVWGEPGGGSGKPTVERHVQTELRATMHTSSLIH